MNTNESHLVSVTEGNERRRERWGDNKENFFLKKNRIGKRNGKEKRRKQEQGRRKKRKDKCVQICFPVAGDQANLYTGVGVFHITKQENQYSGKDLVAETIQEKIFCLTFFMTCLVCFLIQ